MKNNFLGYILRMLVFCALIAFLPSEFIMIIGTSLIAVTAMMSSFTGLAVMTALGVVIFSVLSNDFLYGLLTVLAFVVPGIIQGMMIRSRKSLSGILAATTFARGGFLVLSFDRISKLENLSIKETIMGDTSQVLMEKFKGDAYPEEITEMLSSIIDTVSNMIPATIVISALSFAFLSLAFTKFYTRMTPLLFAGMRKLSDIKMDVSLTIASVVMGVVVFYVDSDFKLILINCIYVLYFMYSVTGFAFTYRLLKKALKYRAPSFFIACVISVISLGLITPVMGIVGSFIKTDFDKINDDSDIENGKDE